MSEHTQEGTDTGAEGDSSVIRELRAQLKSAQEKAKLADEMRGSAAESVLTDLGYPKLKDLFLERVQELPTRESAAQFLEGLGLEPKAQTAQPDHDGGGEGANKAPAADPGSVSDLGQRVAAAAGGGSTGPSIEQQLIEAKSPQEIAEIMEKAGAVISI